MNAPVAPPRRKSKTIRWILLLLVLSAGGFGIYTRYFREPKVTIAPSLELFENTSTIAGREFTLAFYASEAALAEKASQAAYERAREILELVDANPGSALSQLNEAAPDVARTLPGDLFTMVAAAREYAEVTDGAYDPSTGAVTRLWREALAKGQYPVRETFAETLRLSSWKELVIQNADRSIIKKNATLALDLSGVATGYTLDEMMSTLQSQGIRSALITSGSEARISNPPPGEDAWMVAIQRPGRARPDGILLSHCAVSTARVEPATIMLAGREILAELNPTAGLAAREVVVATVIAPRCVMAQALATAAKYSPQLVANFSPGTDIHSRIYTPEQAYLSSGFPRVVAYQKDDPSGQSAAEVPAEATPSQ